MVNFKLIWLALLGVEPSVVQKDPSSKRVSISVAIQKDQVNAYAVE